MRIRGDPSDAVLLLHSGRNAPTTAQEALAIAKLGLVAASSLEDALAWMDDASPSLIVVDPDGFAPSPAALVTELREHSSEWTPPILVIAGDDQLPDIGEVFDAGASDYARKPVDWSLLVHRIRTRLRDAILEVT